MNTKVKNIIGLKELRENMESYIDRVAKGESITVLRRNKPIFRLSPLDEEVLGWESIIDFTEINPRGVSGKEILKRLKKING